MKMSDVFNLPLEPFESGIADMNQMVSDYGFHDDGRDKAATHAINNYDKLVEAFKKSNEALKFYAGEVSIVIDNETLLKELEGE